MLKPPNSQSLLLFRWGQWHGMHVQCERLKRSANVSQCAMYLVCCRGNQTNFEPFCFELDMRVPSANLVSQQCPIQRDIYSLVVFTNNSLYGKGFVCALRVNSNFSWGKLVCPRMENGIELRDVLRQGDTIYRTYQIRLSSCLAFDRQWRYWQNSPYRFYQEHQFLPFSLLVHCRNSNILWIGQPYELYMHLERTQTSISIILESNIVERTSSPGW